MSNPPGVPPARPHIQIPAGYYMDPTTGDRRYWTGNEWGAVSVTNDPGFHAAAPIEEPATGLITCGYIFAVLFPLVGFILGIVIATRPEKPTNKHGWIVIVVSVLAFFVYLLILISAASHSVNTTGGDGFNPNCLDTYTC